MYIKEYRSEIEGKWFELKFQMRQHLELSLSRTKRALQNKISIDPNAI